MSKCRDLIVGMLLAGALSVGSALAQSYGLGRAALPDEIAAWDVDVLPDGRGLPPGRGNVLEGEEKFTQTCAVCHGDFAEGVGNWPTLAGGQDTLDQDDPTKTVGSYWPYLSTLWDYLNRSKPYGNAQSLEVDEVYALVAFLLYSNDIVDEEFELSQENFLAVNMPNADGFIIDDRPQSEYPGFSQQPCMANCKPVVRITTRAGALDVTPQSQPAPQPVTLGDAARGQQVYNTCKNCHEIGPGAKNRVGPHLNGIFGRKAASIDGFKFSKSLQGAAGDGLIWDLDTLDAYLENPRALVSGTRMSFRGLEDPQDRRDVLTYLRGFADNPTGVSEAGASTQVREVELLPETLAIVGDVEFGEYLSGECAVCHQRGGGDQGIPSITQWPAEDFVLAMHAYKLKIRANPVMQMMAGRLSDEEIAALAAYFATVE